MAKIFLDEYDRVRALGGHYVLSYHSQVLATPERVPSLAIVARRLVRDTAVWVAPVGDVAAWWRERAALDARARVAGNVMKIVIRNRGGRAVRGAVVRVALPENTRAVRSDTRVLPSASARTLRLVVPTLAPHSARTMTVALIAPK